MTIGYLAFVVPLIPFGIALEANGPGGPDRGAALSERPAQFVADREDQGTPGLTRAKSSGSVPLRKLIGRNPNGRSAIR